MWNLHRALQPFDKRRFRLTIIDVASGGGDDEWVKNLEADRIIVTRPSSDDGPG